MTFTPAPTLIETGITIEELRGCYSDMHKDAYGFRPRNWDAVKTWTHEDFEEVLKYLQQIIENNIESEKQEKAKAAVEVEARIAKLIEFGAADRQAAIRWLHDAEKTNGDNNYLCFCLGVEYGYFS
jgi:hypothetical protein